MYVSKLCVNETSDGAKSIIHHLKPQSFPVLIKSYFGPDLDWNPHMFAMYTCKLPLSFNMIKTFCLELVGRLYIKKNKTKPYLSPLMIYVFTVMQCFR